MSIEYGTAAEVGMSPERLTLLHDRALKWCDGFRMRSATMLIARRGKIVFHEAYGPLTDRPDSPPLLKDSVFSISSLTKPMVATAIMMLVEDGLLGLNRPLMEYLPEISGKGSDAIEVQHLLSHTSGYDDAACWAQLGQQLSGQVERTGNPTTGLSDSMAQYLACLWNKSIDFEPGSELIYCNHNYALLVEIVRRVSGSTPENFMQERVFDVLNMVDSTCYRDDSKLDRQMIRGEGAPFGSVVGDPRAGHEGEWLRSTFWGYMGINSTAFDLAAFGQMYLDGGVFNEKRILSPQTVLEMTRNQTEGLTMEINGHAVDQASLGWGGLFKEIIVTLMFIAPCFRLVALHTVGRGEICFG